MCRRYDQKRAHPKGVCAELIQTNRHTQYNNTWHTADSTSRSLGTLCCGSILWTVRGDGWPLVPRRELQCNRQLSVVVRHATSVWQGNWFSVAIGPDSKATQ